jgi:hypothetical protein
MAAHAGRDRPRREGRRAAFRDPRPRILIVCEGENTEPQYFEQFADFHRNSLVTIKLESALGVPLSMVRAATALKEQAIANAKREADENIKYESVWCVFDIDEHPHIPEARNLAGDNEIQLAVSNPCFELWLLLHLRDCPGILHRHAAKAMLKTHVPNYDKNVDFRTYSDGYQKAVVRAKYLDNLACSIGEPGRNPTTGVYELTEKIIPPPPSSPLPRPWQQICAIQPETPPPEA